MKLLIIKEKENTVKVIPEDRLDIIILFYIFYNNKSKLITQIYWQEKIDSGLKTVRTSRKPVRVLIQPLNTRFNHDLTGIRITGRVVGAHPEEELKGRKLGVDILINHEIEIEETEEVKKIVRLTSKKGYRDLIIVIFDIRSIVLAEISNSITILDEVYILKSKTYTVFEEDERKIFNKIFERIRELRRKYDYIVGVVNIATKKHIKRHRSLFDYIIEGDFSGSYSGIIQVLKSDLMRKLKISNRILDNFKAYEELMIYIYSDKIIYGLDNIVAGIENRGIRILFINYQKVLENENIINIILKALENRVSVSIIDRVNSIGRLVNRYGGIVGILK